MVSHLNPAAAGRPARKKIPTAVAWVERDRCSGCEVCMVVCPVDCIVLLPDPESLCNPTCEVLADECIGCKICARDCPWEAISMVPYRPGGEAR